MVLMAAETVRVSHQVGRLLVVVGRAVGLGRAAEDAGGLDHHGAPVRLAVPALAAVEARRPGLGGSHAAAGIRGRRGGRVAAIVKRGDGQRPRRQPRHATRVGQEVVLKGHEWVLAGAAVDAGAGVARSGAVAVVVVEDVV